MRRQPQVFSYRSIRVRIALSCWVMFGFVEATAGAQELPGEKPPTSLARYFPREDLVALIEFEGLDVHAMNWQQTAASKILRETKTGEMLRSLAAEVVERTFGGSQQGKGPGSSDVVAIVEQAFRAGFVFGFSGRPGAAKPACIGLVLRGGGRPPLRALLERFIESNNATYSEPPARLTKPGNRQVNLIGDSQGMGHAWWFEGDDLVFVLLSPQGVDTIIETLDGKRTNAVEHPVRLALAKKTGGFSPLGWAFFEMSAVPTWPPKATTLGFDTIQRLESRWGTSGEALVSQVRLVAPAPRAGILGIFDQPTFSSKKLPPLPSGIDGFWVASLKPAQIFSLLEEQAESLNPNTPNGLNAFAEKIQKLTGRKWKEEILEPLGPQFVLTVNPKKVNAPTNPLAGLAMGFLAVPRVSLKIEVKDSDAYAKVLDDVAKGVNQAFAPSADEPNAKSRKLEVKPLQGDGHGYVLSVSPSLIPLPAGVRPTILLGRGSLVLATTPDTAHASLTLENQAREPAANDLLTKAMAGVPESLTLLGVRDDRSSLLPEFVANLPMFAQFTDIRRLLGVGAPNAPFQMVLRGRVAVRMPQQVRPSPTSSTSIDPDLIPSPDDLRPFLFPARYTLSSDDEGVEFESREAFPVFNPTANWPIILALALPAQQAARTATFRAQSVNNLKQIGLALHNFHAANETLPPASSKDKNGKSLLSWRVAILPYIGQAPLYNEFHLDEPWDSPHNKTLLLRMPKTFQVPGAKAKPGMTYYQTFSGVGTLFEPGTKQGLSFAHVLDGTSNTLAVVEARDAVPWTKPDSEIEVDLEQPANFIGQKPLNKLGGHFPGGFNALFADGSVKFLKETINLQVLRALITRNGGEVVSSDAF